MFCNPIYIRIVPENIASKQSISGGENPDENLSFSSREGEEYEAASFGSGIQPPGLTPGYTFVHENCCRARYKPSTGPKNSAYYICLNKSSCRSLYGGTDHSTLRSGQRAEPGVYQGNYGKDGKLLSAQADTRTTVRALELASYVARASDRAHAASLNACPPSSSPSTIFAAEDQLISDIEGKVEQQITESSGANLTAKDTMLFNLLSYLYQKIDGLGKNTQKRVDERGGHGNQQTA